MQYIGTIYRPPSEAYSLIIQMTVGCSHNRCAFCDMYLEKHFFVRPVQEVLDDISWCRKQYNRIGRIFLADGDALIAKTEDLLRVLEAIRTTIPECERVTSYASPSSIRLKTEEELERLRAAGLSMVYMGLESGCDTVLEQMNKGFSAAEIVAAAQKVRAAGICLSVTAISGLGGRALWREHAMKTALALSRMKAEYIGLLTLMVERGTPVAQWVAEGTMKLLSAQEVLAETHCLLAHTDSEGSVFRMNHASNYLTLAGTLNRDRDAMLRKIESGMDDETLLRSECFRAL